MGKPIVVLAIPTGEPLKNAQPPKRVMRLATDLSRLMPEFEIVVSHSGLEREAHAVNLLIEDFRNHPRSLWFVWWNPTVEVTAAQVRQLITCGQAVCGAICTRPDDAAQWDAGFYPDVLPDENQLVPVPELGAGVKVFHRAIFDMIEKNTPDLSYIYDHSGRSCFAFCQEELANFGDYRRLLSPANYLDMLCREAQLGIWAHAGVVLKRRNHLGRMEPEQEPYRPWLFKREPPPVCVEDLPLPAMPRKWLASVFIQYCDKDEDQAKRLRDHIASGPFGFTANMTYSAGKSYPAGPNKKALELLRMDHGTCDVVLLLEPDCCPLVPGFLIDLLRDWDRAAAAGKLIMGSWHPINADHPTLGHLNGNLMFSPKLRDVVQIPDVPDDKPWDTYLAATFAPHWCRTGLIKNLNRHKTATTKQMSTPECGTKPPVLLHGIKDDSAWNYAKVLCASKSSV